MIISLNTVALLIALTTNQLPTFCHWLAYTCTCMYRRMLQPHYCVGHIPKNTCTMHSYVCMYPHIGLSFRRGQRRHSSPLTESCPPLELRVPYTSTTKCGSQFHSSKNLLKMWSQRVQSFLGTSPQTPVQFVYNVQQYRELPYPCSQASQSSTMSPKLSNRQLSTIPSPCRCTHGYMCNRCMWLTLSRPMGSGLLE